MSTRCQYNDPVVITIPWSGRIAVGTEQRQEQQAWQNGATYDRGRSAIQDTWLHRGEAFGLYERSVKQR